MWRATFLAVIWSIWKERNRGVLTGLQQRCFDGSSLLALGLQRVRFQWVPPLRLDKVTKIPLTTNKMIIKLEVKSREISIKKQENNSIN